MAHAQTRPPITGIATFAVKVGDMDEAKKFYSGILGFDEIFVSKATGGTVFKINDHQYVELSPGLKGDEDRGPYKLPQGKSEIDTVRQSPGLEDLWQLNSPTEDRLVVNINPENCPGRWLKVTAQEDGSFSVTNVGNGFSKHYGPRPVHK